jgi:hypothetical protein
MEMRVKSLSLSLNNSGGEFPLSEDESTALLQHLAAASSLQNLDIDGLGLIHATACVGDYVTSLQQLQSLTLTGDHPVTRAEALTLTKLTNLRVLNLDGAAGVDDVAAVALAARLTKLRSLSLVDCDLRSAAALPVIAMLTALTQLNLCHNHPLASELSAEDLLLLLLLLLAPLRQLREFRSYGFVDEIAMEQPWDHNNGSWREQP